MNMMFLVLNQQRGNFSSPSKLYGIMCIQSIILGAKQSQLFSDCQEQLTSISQTYKRILKYREENVNGVKDDKERIKENMKKMMFLVLNQQRGNFSSPSKLYGIMCIQSIILPRIPYTSSQMW
jgi:hypothetical protein